jgi:LPXTG-motif cell wall-anchored protein
MREMMKFFKVVPTVFCAALLSATFAPTANADDWNRKTVVTFSEPVEIPGVHLQGWGVLPAGTYVFKILDSKSDRHIVQIFSQDELTIYATILAIPNYRLRATDKTVMTFNEGIEGRPEALRAWFYPGRNWGEEFVYPKAKAMEIAAATKTPVLFTAAEIPVEVVAPIKSVDEPVVVQLRQAPILAVQPTGEQVQLAVVVTPPPPAELAIIETAPAPVESLPDTGSSLPLIALFGMLSLGGALAVRSMRNRTI